MKRLAWITSAGFFIYLFIFSKCQNAFRWKPHQDGGSGLNLRGVTEFSEHLHEGKIHRLQQESKMQGKVYRNLSNKWVLKHNTQKQKTFFPLPTSTTETPRCFAGTRHPVGENGPASWHSRKSVTSLPLVPRIRFQYEHLQPASPTPVKRISLVKVEEKLQALTSWQKYLWVYPPVGLRGGWGGGSF